MFARQNQIHLAVFAALVLGMSNAVALKYVSPQT